MISTSLPFFPSPHLKTHFPICTLNPSISHHDVNYTAAGAGVPCYGRQTRKWVLLSNDQKRVVVEAPTSSSDSLPAVLVPCYGRQTRKWVLLSNDQRVVVEAPTSSSDSLPAVLVDSASTVVRKFYQGINGHDLGSVENLIAENCVYEDLIFPQPFVGRKAILKFFKLFNDSISTDLQFVIDDISENDPSGVGVTWHLEWKGKPFPFSRGVSFYRLETINGQRQICYGRDSVEPAFKPGESALVAIRGVVWLLQRFPKLTDFL